jgi:CelD/BcsL family acetyltransferase involved in cellulose biosynthesis
MVMSASSRIKRLVKNSPALLRLAQRLRRGFR